MRDFEKEYLELEKKIKSQIDYSVIQEQLSQIVKKEEVSEKNINIVYSTNGSE